MKRNISKIIIVVLLMISIVEGAFLFRAYAIPSDNLRLARKITRIEKLIQKKYTGGKVDQSKLEDYAFKGLVAGLGDIYSTYYSGSEFKELMTETNGVFTGVGLQLIQNQTTKEIRVVKVIENSPSAKTRIAKDDILKKVDGKKISSQQLSKVIQKVRGEDGTKVTLTFQHKAKEYSVTITRTSIENPTVEYKMLSGKIGYLEITEFDEVTTKQFKKAVAALKKQGMKSLILDVRDNPGGLLNTVVKIADEIQAQGVIVSTKDKAGNKKVYKATSKSKIGVPMCLLVNGNSASAAEILAGDLKDHKIATLVGTKTFGKGIVQGFYNTGGGSYLKLTSATYYTPSGHNIHKKGIKPNVEVKDNTETTKDEQLEKAKQILAK